MSELPSIERARRLVAEIVTDDLSDAAPDEDLRDYGLDSVRVVDVIARVAEAGGSIGYADLAQGATLLRISAALDAATTKGRS